MDRADVFRRSRLVSGRHHCTIQRVWRPACSHQTQPGSGQGVFFAVFTLCSHCVQGKRAHSFNTHALCKTETRLDGQLSRAFNSRFGRLGNLNLSGLNPGRVKPMTCNSLYLCCIFWWWVYIKIILFHNQCNFSSWPAKMDSGIFVPWIF